MDILTGLIREIWHTFNEAAPYILFGTFMAGVIQTFVDKDRIVRHLGKPGFKSVFMAALFGVPLPLCSCGVLPTAMSLRKNGASRGATLAFMISTPETGIDSIMLSFALLDPIMAVFRPVAAFITAVVAGVMENLLGHKEKALEPPKEEKCPHCSEGAARSIARGQNQHYGKRFIGGMEYAFVDLLGDIALWLALGIGIGGVISFFIPASFIENYLGRGLSAMFIMLLIGIPLYICASASTPIASALIAKGMAPGAALVFLLVGPATNRGDPRGRQVSRKEVGRDISRRDIRMRYCVRPAVKPHIFRLRHKREGVDGKRRAFGADAPSRPRRRAGAGDTDDKRSRAPQ
ncbi:MAG TPA: SO_0444 family Cu/Zn efflux transporter [Spirochaetota bacterium]|nr:SO_0444 family Cu/Zn efflux transporter [Spirochaetota bacterium]